MGSHAALARRWFSEVWGPDGERKVDEMLAPDAVGWMEGREINGAPDFKAARRELLSVFPDLKVTIEDLVEDAAKVAMRWTATATHRGALPDLPATNRPVTFRGMTWWEVRDGRIVRGWDSWNQGALFASLAQSSPLPLR